MMRTAATGVVVLLACVGSGCSPDAPDAISDPAAVLARDALFSTPAVSEPPQRVRSVLAEPVSISIDGQQLQLLVDRHRVVQLEAGASPVTVFVAPLEGFQGVCLYLLTADGVESRCESAAVFIHRGVQLTVTDSHTTTSVGVSPSLPADGP